MQKLKAILISIICISLVLLSGCRSLPESKKNSVNPFDVMDSRGFIYFSVPKNCDPELYNRILENSGFSNPKQISKNIDKIFFNFSQSKTGDFLEVQGVIQGNIPSSIIEKNLEKNWAREDLIYQNKKYKIFHNNGFELSVPSNKMVLFGRDNSSMLKNYHDCLYGLSEKESDFDYNFTSFLMESDDEIRFTCCDISYIVALFMPELGRIVKSDFIMASVKPDLYNKNFYIMDAKISFSKEYYMKAAKAILHNIVYENGGTIRTEGTDLFVDGFAIKKELIYSLRLL